MAFTYGDIMFDPLLKYIKVEAGVLEITCQEIYDACKLFEAEPHRLDDGLVCVAEGKKSLGGGRFVGMTLELVNDWRLHFGDYVGPDFISKNVTGGNLIATNQYDDRPVAGSTFTLVTIAQDTSASFVETLTSGLTTSESDKLDDVHGTTIDITVMRKIMTNRITTDPNTGILRVFDDDDTTILYQGNIWEDVTALQIYRGQGIEHRGKLGTVTNVFAPEFAEEFD